MFIFQIYKQAPKAQELLTEQELNLFLWGKKELEGAYQAFAFSSGKYLQKYNEEKSWAFSDEYMKTAIIGLINGESIITRKINEIGKKDANAAREYYNNVLSELKNYLKQEYGIETELSPIKNSKNQIIAYELKPLETKEEMAKKIKDRLQMQETKEKSIAQETSKPKTDLTVKPTITATNQTITREDENTANLQEREEIYSILYTNSNSIAFLLNRLASYSNWDDLTGLKEIGDNLLLSYTDLLNRLREFKSNELEEYVKKALLYFREALPDYLKGIIEDNGSLNVVELSSKIGGLVYATKAINELDSLLAKAFDGPLDANDLKRARELMAELQGRKDALSFILTQRYGEKGEGLKDAREIFGLPQSKEDVAGQYFGILRKIIYEQGYLQLWGIGTEAKARYPKAMNVLSGYAIDPVTNEPIRPSFDFISRLAFFKLISSGATESISDEQLAAMAIAAGNMAPGHSSLIWNYNFFANVLGQIEPETAATGAENAGGMRQQIFSHAVVLMNAAYANSKPQERYEKAKELMSYFEKLKAAGNLVTELERGNITGLERGHIEIKSPLSYTRPPIFWQDYATLYPFAYSALWQNSLFSYNRVPQVYPGIALQPTDLNYQFNLIEWQKDRFFSTMPSAAWYMLDYGENYLGKRANYGLILGAMNEAYNQVMSSLISGLEIQAGNISAQASGKDDELRGDLSATMQGRRFGQYAYLEGYARKETTKGTMQPYMPYDKSKEDSEYARANASQLQILGTNVWNALATYYRNHQINLNDEQGNPINIGGLKDYSEDWDYNSYLNSTFPLALDGTTIVFANGSGRTYRPTESGGYGKQESTSKYDIDAFMKRGGVWIRVIDRNRTEELLKQTANGKETLQDSLNHYFAQIYAGNAAVENKGSTHAIDAAAEMDARVYNKTKRQPTETRYGVMLIYQPSTPFAAGGAKSTEDNAAAFLGFEGESWLAMAGVYSFNPEVEPYFSLWQGAPYYYTPIYELGQKQPNAMPNLLNPRRTIMASGTILALEKFRATIYGGWRGQDDSIMVGEEFLAKQSNVSSYFRFDQNKKLEEALVGVGGKARKLDLGSLKLEEISGKASYAKTTWGGDILSGWSSIDVGPGRLFLNANVQLSNLQGQSPLKDRTISGLLKSYNGLMNDVGSTSLGDLTDYQKRKGKFRNWMNISQTLVSDAILLQPPNDLYSAWPINISIGYQSKEKPYSGGQITGSLTEDGGIFWTGMVNWENKAAFIGGLRVGEKIKSQDDAYLWLFGGKIMPADDVAAYLFVGETKDRGVIGTIAAGARNLPGIDSALFSASAGNQYYVVRMNIGNRDVSGVISLSGIGGLHSTEIGARIALSSAFYIAAALQQTTIPGFSSLKTFDPNDPMVQQASRLGLIPYYKIIFEQGKFDISYLLSNNTVLHVTGQLNQARGKDTPLDFYVGARIQWWPK